MTRPAHSPEPWSRAHEEPGAGGKVFRLVDAAGMPVGVLHAPFKEAGARGHPDDDARRIVDCVSACEGVAQPDTAVDQARDALGSAIGWLEAVARAEDEVGGTRLEDAGVDFLRLRAAKEALGLSAGERLALELMDRPERRPHERA